jgi:hypothetical protein
MSLLGKSAHQLAVVKDLPQDLIEAGKRKVVALERERLEQASRHETNRLSLQTTGTKPQEVRSSLPPQQKALETEEDCVFDMRKLDQITGRGEPAKTSSWEDSAQPAKGGYWGSPDSQRPQAAEEPAYGGFSTGMPRQSNPQMNRSQSVAQMSASQESFGDPSQMASQMQQWMSMMMTNPEAMAQMQQSFATQQPPTPSRSYADPNDPFSSIETSSPSRGGDFRSAQGAVFKSMEFASEHPELAHRAMDGVRYAAEHPELASKAVSAARTLASKNPFATEAKGDKSGFFNL